MSDTVPSLNVKEKKAIIALSCVMTLLLALFLLFPVSLTVSDTDNASYFRLMFIIKSALAAGGLVFSGLWFFFFLCSVWSDRNDIKMVSLRMVTGILKCITFSTLLMYAAYTFLDLENSKPVVNFFTLQFDLIVSACRSISKQRHIFIVIIILLVVALTYTDIIYERSKKKRRLQKKKELTNIDDND